MYDSIRKELYWPHIVNNLYATVRDITVCERSPTRGKGAEAQPVPFQSPTRIYRYEDTAIPSKTMEDSYFMVVMTDC